MARLCASFGRRDFSGRDRCADTSPLNYLIQIDCDELLPQLYKTHRRAACCHTGAEPRCYARRLRAWLTHVPAWIDVRASVSPPDAGLAFLDLGEREAIQLAHEQHADLLLIDERKGRLEARRRGLRTTGTLGVLLSAGELRLIDAEGAYRRLLAETTFRTSAALEVQFLGQLRSSPLR